MPAKKRVFVIETFLLILNFLIYILSPDSFASKNMPQ
jgi:hypothetical protein